MTQSWITKMDFVHTYVLIPKEEENTNGWTWKWWHWGKHWSRQLKASFPGPPAMRKAEPAKSFRRSRPERWLALILSSPPYHTHKPHRKIVSLPSYLCLLAILLFMPSPRLSPFLAAVTVFCLLCSGALRSSCSLQGRHRGGGLGARVLLGCADSVKTNSHFYRVYRQFE